MLNINWGKRAFLGSVCVCGRDSHVAGQVMGLEVENESGERGKRVIIHP